MRNLKTLLVVTLAVAGAALAVPAFASADTFCVNAGAACPAGGVEIGDLQAALNQAAALDTNDELLLGDKQTPYFGPFTYSSASRVGSDLAIKGVGGRPSLTVATGGTVLSLAGGSVENISILADSGDGAGITASGAVVKNVVVKGQPSATPDMVGIGASATRLEDVEIDGGFEPALNVPGSQIDSSLVVAQGLHIHGGDSIGALVHEFAELDLDNSRIASEGEGIISDGFTRIRRSVIETTDPESFALAQSFSFGGYDLDHVTLAHLGTPSGTDAAIKLHPAVPLDTHLHAVAIAGYTRGFKRIHENGDFPENVVISDSVWDPSNDQADLGAGVFVENRNLHAAPELVNLAGGDLHLRAGSAAIDRDQVSDLSQFTDLEGVPALDGDGDGIVRPDAGAFEFRPAAPPPAGGGGGGNGGGSSGSGGAGNGPPPDLIAPALAKLRLVAGGRPVARAARVPIARARKLRLAFTASETSTVRIVPRRVVGGRLAKPGRAIVRAVAAGRGSIALGKSLRRAGVFRPGEVRLVVTARDAAGNLSAKHVLALRLKA